MRRPGWRSTWTTKSTASPISASVSEKVVCAWSRMTRLEKRRRAFSVEFAWIVARDPACPVLKESSSVRASTPRTSPMMIRYGRQRRKDFRSLSNEMLPLNVSVWHSAGTTIPVYDATTGQAWPASLFVSVLGASSYTHAEATRDQQLEAWIQAHIHTLEFLGGVPKLAVPDNTKTAGSRACRYDADLNPTYQEVAGHYGRGVLPARPYKPRDKAKAESGGQVVERGIVPALRNPKLFNLPE